MALELNNVITYGDMIEYVVSYIKQLYDNRNSIIIPSVSNKSDCDSKSWQATTGKHVKLTGGAGHSSASVTMTITYNEIKDAKDISIDAIRTKLDEFLKNHATDIDTNSIIISKSGDIINFQYIMNFFNIIIKFINTYFLTYTLSTHKEYMPTNYTTSRSRDKLTSNSTFSNIIHDILSVDDKWILKSTFSSSVTSSSSCSSSSSSSSSCSSSSSSSFITYLNIE